MCADYLKAQSMAADMDIHAVAGLLKKYFRQLPEPLFTDPMYTSFIQGFSESVTLHSCNELPTAYECIVPVYLDFTGIENAI